MLQKKTIFCTCSKFSSLFSIPKSCTIYHLFATIPTTPNLLRNPCSSLPPLTTETPHDDVSVNNTIPSPYSTTTSNRGRGESYPSLLSVSSFQFPEVSRPLCLVYTRQRQSNSSGTAAGKVDLYFIVYVRMHVCMCVCV